MTTFTINSHWFARLFGIASLNTTPPGLHNTSHVLLWHNDSGQTVLRSVGNDRVTTELQITSTVTGGPGKVLLTPKTVARIAAECTGDEIQIEVSDQMAVITTENSVYRIVTPDADAFPTADHSNDDAFRLELPAESLKRQFGHCVRATDPNSSRFAIGGVCLDLRFDDFSIVATDAKQLVVYGHGNNSVPTESRFFSVIPNDATKVLDRLLGLLDQEAFVELFITDGKIHFQSDQWSLRCSSIAGKYPNWQMVIPPEQQHGIHFIGDARSLASSARLASVTTTEDSTAVRLVADDGKLKLSASSDLAGMSSIECDGELTLFDDEQTFVSAFDSGILTSALRQVSHINEKLEIFQSTPTAPLLIRPVSGSFKHVIMPLAVN